MKKLIATVVAGTALMATIGCVSTKDFNARMSSLEDRVGMLEQAQKARTGANEADMKKIEDAANHANDAAIQAEAAAKKAEEYAEKSATAEKAASGSEKKAAKEFELMQKK